VAAVAAGVAVIGALAAALAATAPAPALARHPAAPHLAAPVTAAVDAAENPATFRTAADRPVVIPAPPRHAPADARATLVSSPSPAPAAPAVTCPGGQPGGMLPENYAAIVNFLAAHGYTGLAAAGIAGNIYQESGGNPESEGDGGGGLIGWTPLPAGYVTGNAAADLQTQLQALLAFNQQWAQYIPALNAATSAAQAAGIFVQDFERAGDPAAGTREASAAAVAAACGL
jgi:Phage tail lysozyme